MKSVDQAHACIVKVRTGNGCIHQAQLLYWAPRFGALNHPIWRTALTNDYSGK